MSQRRSTTIKVNSLIVTKLVSIKVVFYESLKKVEHKKENQQYNFPWEESD